MKWQAALQRISMAPVINEGSRRGTQYQVDRAQCVGCSCGPALADAAFLPISRATKAATLRDQEVAAPLLDM